MAPAAPRLLLRPSLFFSILIFIFPPIHSISESESLLKVKNSFISSDSLSSWTPNSTPCAKIPWTGIICNEGTVSAIRLHGMGLAGKIDVDALLELKGLRGLSLMNNSFSGPIPELNQLGYLKALYLANNQFTGEIPDDYFAQMESLKKVWLSNNNFSGKIPSSLAQASNLHELHLENNKFTGEIPIFSQTSITSLNVSNNELEGEIPVDLVNRFQTIAFAGNAGLCSEKIGKPCTKQYAKHQETKMTPSYGNEGSTPDNSTLSNKTTTIVAISIASSIVVVSIMVIVFIKSKKRGEDFNKLRKQSAEYQLPAVEVHVADHQQPSSNHKREVMTTSLKKNSSSRKSTSSRGGGGGAGEIVVVNDEKGVFGLQDLMKAAAEVLGNGGLGSSYKAMMLNGAAVVVKRIREMNVMAKEGFELEMRRFGKLKHWNILTPLAYLFRNEEKLLVSEYVPKGSLLYVLHGDRGSAHAELDWPNRLKIIKGIAKGLNFLHIELSFLDLPHGNLKSSNVLLSPDNEPLLTDYGFSPMINRSNRSQSLFAYKSPEAIQLGRVSPKSDVYCLGILILEILTGKYPSQYVRTGKGGIDVVEWVSSAISEGRESDLLDPEISANAADSIGNMEKMLRIGVACAESDPERRLDMTEAIRRIQEIRRDGGIQDARTIQLLPSLRDGYADSTIEVQTEH